MKQIVFYRATTPDRTLLSLRGLQCWCCCWSLLANAGKPGCRLWVRLALVTLYCCCRVMSLPREQESTLSLMLKTWALPIGQESDVMVISQLIMRLKSCTIVGTVEKTSRQALPPIQDPSSWSPPPLDQESSRYKGMVGTMSSCCKTSRSIS